MNTGFFAGGRTFALLALCVALSVGAACASPFMWVSGAPKTLTAAAIGAAAKAETRGAADKKTLTFRQPTIRLVVQTGPDTDMLSYRIAGLRNPTLIIPRGALLKVMFINSDDDMFHDIRFGTGQKSYPNAIEQLVKSSVGTPPLPHKSEAAYHAESLILRAPTVPGTYAYFCTVRGHAQGGMWGDIIVR